MPISKHLDRTFDPEAVNEISIAFELACADLAVFANDQPGREIIALRIIDLALDGTRDAATLHTRVVDEVKSMWCHHATSVAHSAIDKRGRRRTASPMRARPAPQHESDAAAPFPPAQSGIANCY